MNIIVCMSAFFSYSLTFTVKKEGFGGGGTRTIQFNQTHGNVAVLKPSGRTLNVSIGAGLPNTTSKNNATVLVYICFGGQKSVKLRITLTHAICITVAHNCCSVIYLPHCVCVGLAWVWCTNILLWYHPGLTLTPDVMLTVIEISLVNVVIMCVTSLVAPDFQYWLPLDIHPHTPTHPSIHPPTYPPHTHPHTNTPIHPPTHCQIEQWWNETTC